MTVNHAATTPAEMRALAEQAEVEAAEAEALAAAARARARALQLRREAEIIEATQVPAKDTEDGDAQEVRTGRQLNEAQAEETTDNPTRVNPALSDDAADASQESPNRRWYRRRRFSTVASGLAVIVILALLAGSAVIFWEHRNASQRREQAAQFAAAAQQGVINLTSLDFNDAKHGVQHILDVSTGTFKDDFGKSADDFVKVVEQSKVVEKGSVSAVAVDLDSMTKDSAVVLVSSLAEVTNAAGAKQDPRRYRLIVTVTRDGGQLKMSKVEFVP